MRCRPDLAHVQQAGVHSDVVEQPRRCEPFDPAHVPARGKRAHLSGRKVRANPPSGSCEDLSANRDNGVRHDGHIHLRQRHERHVHFPVYRCKISRHLVRRHQLACPRKRPCGRNLRKRRFVRLHEQSARWHDAHHARAARRHLVARGFRHGTGADDEIRQRATRTQRLVSCEHLRKRRGHIKLNRSVRQTHGDRTRQPLVYLPQLFADLFQLFVDLPDAASRMEDQRHQQHEANQKRAKEDYVLSKRHIYMPVSASISRAQADPRASAAYPSSDPRSSTSCGPSRAVSRRTQGG